MLDNLKNKKILILGLGREGISTFKILRQLFPKNTFCLADQSSDRFLLAPLHPLPPSVRLHLGPGYLKNLDDYDLIIKSPGIPFLPELVKTQKAGKITSQIKLFFENCPGKIIGLTGTKGKSTTASLIYKILTQAYPTGPTPGVDYPRHTGKKIYLAGNIGTPVLPLLEKADKNSLFVFELSSHQLADLKISPYIAVLLNIYPEHLDYYQSLNDYIEAKTNIVLYQTANDWLVYDADNPSSAAVSQKSRAQKLSFSLTDKKADLYPDKNYLYFRRSPIFPISQIPLMGKFNLKNVMAAIAVAKILKVPGSTINKAVKTFKPLPHRLELVGTFKGITFYNDSLATNPQATIEAIRALNEISTLIIGGFDRGGMDFEPVGKAIIKAGIKTVILFPPTGKKIWSAIENRFPSFLPAVALAEAGPSSPSHFFVKDMAEAVKLAYNHTPSGTICLLSCASASFGIFKDYADRGNQFKKYASAPAGLLSKGRLCRRQLPPKLKP